MLKRLIDVQTFLGSNPAFGIESKVQGFEQRQAELRRQGYEARFIVMPAGVEANATLVQTVYERPDLFLGGVLQINSNPSIPEIGYTSVSEIEQLVQREEVLGLKLNNWCFTRTRLTDDSLKPYLALAQHLNLPVTIHCGKAGKDYDSVSMVEMILTEFPTLKIVCANGGGWKEPYPSEYAAFAQKHIGQVWIHLAGVTGEDAQIQCGLPVTIRRAEPNRSHWEVYLIREGPRIHQQLLWASDFPHLQSPTLEPVTRLPSAFTARILYKNTLQCYVGTPHLTAEKVERCFSSTNARLATLTG